MNYIQKNLRLPSSLTKRRTFVHDTTRTGFRGKKSFNNGNNQVMGGILAAIMDVTVAQAAVIYSKNTQTVSTLEQKTSLIGPVRLSRKKDQDEDVPLMCRDDRLSPHYNWTF